MLKRIWEETVQHKNEDKERVEDQRRAKREKLPLHSSPFICSDAHQILRLFHQWSGLCVHYGQFESRLEDFRGKVIVILLFEKEVIQTLISVLNLYVNHVNKNQCFTMLYIKMHMNFAENHTCNPQIVLNNEGWQFGSVILTPNPFHWGRCINLPKLKETEKNHFKSRDFFYLKNFPTVED